MKNSAHGCRGRFSDAFIFGQRHFCEPNALASGVLLVSSRIYPQLALCGSLDLNGRDRKDTQNANPDNTQHMPAPAGECDAPVVFVVVAIFKC